MVCGGGGEIYGVKISVAYNHLKNFSLELL